MSVPAVTQPAHTDFQCTEGVSTEQVPTEAAMSAPAVPQPTQVALEATEQVPIDAALSEPAVPKQTHAVSEENETIETAHVFTEVTMSAPAVPEPTQVAMEATEQVPIDAALSAPAVSKPTQAVSEETETLQTVQEFTEAVTSEPAVPEPTQAALESTLLAPVSNVCNEVVGAPAPSEPAPTKSTQPTPLWTEKVRRVRAVPKPSLNRSDRVVLTQWTENIRSVRAVPKPTLNGPDRPVPSQWTDTHSRIEAMRAKGIGRVQPRQKVVRALKGLQVTATSRKHSTSSLVASPEDASAKNAVATGTDSRAGVSEGTKRVEDAEDPNCSAQKTAGDTQEKMGEEEAATSGLQMPGAWPSDPPVVTASGESDMHEGSALLRVLRTGTRWASVGVFAMVMVTLLSSPLWLGHLGHLAYAFEGPEQFLEELREEHGYVPFLEWVIYVFLRSFAGDRTLFG
ncbi:hypothetical protein N7519_007284 [Penicillium mononematosum]|uniref:uncharacterized protein n=1 Tax=Penicillium mononematosum TaxID=268346 RepID=UPI002548A3D7|nr:uncharacterized protein N7519_007284 [Penicillium mononematosum]KAJ6185983.1 hypothetical protein N7519_007284 [Penicillium mononematosum]